METNSVNTDLSEELLNSLAKEERTELLDFINNYPFINWMVSANRPYAKDVPKDKTGKIIVDVVKPHILENTNYFRKAAIAYKKYGRYTNLRPNGNPNSPYMKWLRKEVLKCWYGCKRPSDGEWITGYHYFYLNYSPIERSTSTVGDSKAVGRVVDFPDFYDLDYLFFHYVNQARYGGKYNNYEGGQHCGIIAARGKGKMIPNSTIVYTPNGYKVWKDIHPGDYLYGDDGKPTKVLEEFNHKSKPIYKLTLKDGRIAYAGLEHLWTVLYGPEQLTVDTQWIIEHLHKDRIIIPLNKPVQIKEKPISLDPFRYGLSIKTRVSDNYKYNSESIRRKVLEGILSRSKIIGFGTVKFTTKYSKLAEDVLWLGRSLGYICREEKIRVRNRTVYSVYIQNFYTGLDKYIEITNVEYSHNEDAKCVIVDNDSHLFLMNDFIVTHNSFKVSSMSARNFILGENMDVCEKVKSLVVASNTEYLRKDGTLNKTLAMADFLAKSTQFPSNRVKSSTQDMHWIMGYKDPKNKDVVVGTKNEILGLSFNNDSDRGRGKRPVAYGTKILTPNGYVKAEELKVGDIIYGDDGKETKIIAVPFDGEEELYKITLRDKRTIIVGKDHEFEVTYNNKKKITEILPLSKIIKLKNSNKNNVVSIRNNSVIQFKEQELKIHPYVMGLFLGDGCYRQSHNNAINITMSLKDIKAIAKHIPYNIEYSKFREITHRIHLIEEDSKSYAKKILDYYGLKNKKCHDKFIPKEYLYNSEENRYELLRGLMDTDGTCTKEHCIEYCTKSPQLKEDIMFLIRSLGMNCTCYKKIIKENVYYRVRIFATNKSLFHLERKQERVRKEGNKFSKAYTDKTSILSIEYYGKGNAKCFTVDNKSHLFLAEDFIITHNSQLIVWEEFGMFPNFLDAWNTSRPNTEEGGFAFGQSIAIGCVCAGSKVFTKNGDIKNIEDLKIEDGIIGYSSLHKSYSKENISYIQPIKQKECVEIITSGGKIIRCSLDHPILTPNSFIEASKLEIGSNICLINKVSLFGKYEPLNAFLEGRSAIEANSLPIDIGMYSKKALKSFFKGAFSFGKRGKNNSIILENNLSREVLETISLLLLKFGLYSSIDNSKLIVFLNSNLKDNSGFIVEKIVSIKNIGIQTIYNLTANNTHTYLVNGIITHNTGGSEGADFSGALEMIYNPLGYNVYGIPNVYDKGASGGAKCIFFIGEYMNRKGCYDKDGNSDIVKAVLEEVKERVFIKYNSSDPSTIAQRIAEHPMSIQEAIMRRDGTLFPVADLTDHLNYIEANKIEWNRGHLVGELSQDPNGNISFKPTDDEPIRDFPLKDNRHRGALEIYELPKEVNGKVPSYRYIAGVDPIDDDHSTTVSLPSIIVLDMFTDRVVAEYTGRPDFADDFYEICRRLGIFYNALINYENDKKGLFTYFSNNHCTYLLAQTPEILRDTELVKSSLYGNKSFGTQSGKQVNAYARRLIRDWLLMPVKQTKIEIDENGNEVEKTVTVKNLQRLRGVAMIKELIMWNPDINADRVSALGMLMILRENNMKYLPGEGTSIGKKARKNYLGNDPFFTNNFANTTFW